eukprot:m.500231 g.500231  ORF g.500231 m.500231 type:complete len:219 (+) comp21832_c0_seq8:402-1058(+)
MGQQFVTRKAKLGMVVSHGGFLGVAFGKPKLHNCEIRLIDITADGRFLRVAQATPQLGIDENGEYISPPLEIYSIQVSRAHRHKQYYICGVLNQTPFGRIWRLSDVRHTLHRPLKKLLCADDTVVSLGTQEYAANDTMQATIHGFPSSSHKAVPKIRKWFTALSGLLAQSWTTSEIKELAEHFFIGAAYVSWCRDWLLDEESAPAAQVAIRKSLRYFS